MQMTRRHTLRLTIGVAAAVVTGAGVPAAYATDVDAQKLIDEFLNGAEAEAARVTLTIPETAENGNAVPITAAVESKMVGNDLVESILIVAGGNPRPHVAQFNFTEASGLAQVTTRIRLAQSQTVTAVARMADGRAFIDHRDVQVLVGGCTG